jgi:hypothetical protein
MSEAGRVWNTQGILSDPVYLLQTASELRYEVQAGGSTISTAIAAATMLSSDPRVSTDLVHDRTSLQTRDLLEIYGVVCRTWQAHEETRSWMAAAGSNG